MITFDVGLNTTGDAKMSEASKPIDYQKKIVAKLLRNRWTIKLISAEGEQLLTPKEARLVAISIRRQQRIDSQLARRAKKLSDRGPKALVGV